MAETSSTARVIAAEAIGTFALVLLGCGSVGFLREAFRNVQVTDPTLVGLAFGLTLAVVVYVFGRVSGAHVNPAVSVAAAAGGRMAWRRVPVYVGAQLAGAVLGAFVLWVLLHGFDGFDAGSSMGQNAFGDQSPSGYAWWAAFLLELVLTALFVSVILAVTDERFEHPALAPLAIGLALAALHFVAIPATGTSLNPARSIGPALFAGLDAILQLWLFIAAPLLGALAAGVAYPLLFGRADEPVPGSGLTLRRAHPAAVASYGAPDQFQQEWNQQGGDHGTGTRTVPTPEPIVQDGWQWDPIAQQWFPVGQEPPSAQGRGSDS